MRRRVKIESGWEFEVGGHGVDRPNSGRGGANPVTVCRSQETCHLECSTRFSSWICDSVCD